MKYSSRFFLYAPLGVFLLLLAIAGIHWWIAASRLGGWLDARNGHEIIPGVTMRYDARRITGFPFSLDTELHNLRLTLRTEHGTSQWRSEKFAMHALAYGRDETIFEAAGHQMLQSKDHKLAFAVGALRASAIRERGILERFDLDILGLGSTDFTAQRLQFHARRNGADKLETLLLADGLACHGGPQSPQGRQEGSVTRARALSRLLSGTESWQSAITDWRGAGGRYVSSGPSDKGILALKAALTAIRAEELVVGPALFDAVCRRH
jgi:hypothetical protein